MILSRFPDVDKLSPPILMLSEVSYTYPETTRTIFRNIYNNNTVLGGVVVTYLYIYVNNNIDMLIGRGNAEGCICHKMPVFPNPS